MLSYVIRGLQPISITKQKFIYTIIILYEARQFPTIDDISCNFEERKMMLTCKKGLISETKQPHFHKPHH